MFRRSQPVRPGENLPECRDYVTQPLPYLHDMPHGDNVESVSAASTTNFVGQLLLLAASAQGSGTESDA